MAVLAFEPCITRISHDRQKPRPGIVAPEIGKPPQGTQAGLLYDILGIMAVCA